MAVLRDIGIGVLVLMAWCAWCWYFPHKRCYSCRGRKGRGLGSTGLGYSRCRRCGGSGEQVRWTARLISKATGRPVRGSD